MERQTRSALVEWPTFLLIVGTTLTWGLAVFWLPLLSYWVALPVLTFCIALHASLQHEVIHGHPFRSQRLNAALVWPAFALVIPYLRFRDTHLAHHVDSRLTDPYDDPETNYLDPAVWGQMSRPVRWVLRFNNTLLGRLLCGPLLGTVNFAISDIRAYRHGDLSVRAGWLWHLPPLVLVLALVGMSPLPFWAYLIAVYGALSILKLRTFLEHQAHVRASGRSVIVEGRGLFAFLFLNNNLHVVHHMHPNVPWYALPKLYAQNSAHYLRRNGGYRYTSYGQVFRQYLLRGKDPVAHPLWHR